MNGRRDRRQWRRAASLSVAALFAVAVRATAEVTANSAAAIIAYPYIEVDGGTGLDTFVQLTNSAAGDVDILCFYENTTAHCAGTTLPCRTADDCSAGVVCQPGWVPAPFQIHLVRREPIGWRASQGVSTIFDTRVPAVAEDPFIGALRCIVTDQAGAAVASNALIGSATVEQNRTDAKANFDVARYNAIGLAAVVGDADGDGQLRLGGGAPEYQGCANTLILNHFFDQAVEPVLRTRSVQTSLVLLPCSANYVTGTPGQSSVSFSVTNEFDNTVTGDQSFAVTGQLVVPLDSAVLQVGAQGTLTGTMRLHASGAGVIATAFEIHRDLGDSSKRKAAGRSVPSEGERSSPDVIVIKASSPMPTSTATPTLPGGVPTASASTATITPTTTPGVPTNTPTLTVTPTQAAATNTPIGSTMPTRTPTMTATQTRTATPSRTTTETVATSTATETATQTLTVTPTATATATSPSAPTPTDTPVLSLSPTPAGTTTPIAPTCVGDCDGSGTVGVNEVVTGVNIALGRALLSSCPAFDCNGTGHVTVNCLVGGVNAALNSCEGLP